MDIVTGNKFVQDLVQHNDDHITQHNVAQLAARHKNTPDVPNSRSKRPIECDPEPMRAGKLGWPHRAELLSRLPVFSNFAEIEKTDNPSWTDDEKEKLLRLQQQTELFDEVEEGKQIRLLEKLPFDFHYRYECDVDGETYPYKHKLVDWEVGALYRTVRRQHGDAWEVPFRAKLERELPSKNLHFLLGTIHRFPNQWLLISLIYPPKPPVENPNQAGLF